MNEVLKTILSRRSIRRYEERQLKEQDLQEILKAGSFAPSAMNQQSWHFTVIQNRAVIDSIAAAAGKALDRGEPFAPFYNAPTLIVAFGQEGAISPVSDASLALENMFLAAASLGAGSCWINCVIDFFEKTQEGKAMRKTLGIPDGYRCVGSGIFGYPAEQPAAKPRREGTIHYIR